MLRTTLDDAQRSELQQLARQAVGRVSERAHFVLISAQGCSPPRIAKLMGYRVSTVRHWLKAYHRHGSEGLRDAPRSGRPVKDKLLSGVLQAQVSQCPQSYGYLQTCWSVPLMVCHLWRRFRTRVSRTTVRRALKAAGFAWTRPKLVLPKRHDPKAASKLDRLEKACNDTKAVILAEDECDVHLLAVLRAMWQRIGQQLRIVTPGQNAKRGVFGALNLRTGQWHYLLTGCKRSEQFVTFLFSLLNAYPLKTIYVVLDNASIHTSRTVRHWLEEHPDVWLLYLPTCSGHEMNPVEKVWAVLKDHVAKNRCFRSLAELDNAVRRFFTDFTCAHALRLMNSDIARRAQKAVA